jgi:large subunit ribosomal protein L21
MEDYAVIQIAHKQYIVKPGQTYTVDKFPAEEGSKVRLDVLATGKGKDIELGKPLLPAKAEVEILEQGKGEKVTSKIFKAKSRYRRTRGYRQRVTTFKVLSIK